MLHLGDVFVAGGEPTVTYVARDAAALETRLRHYLALRRKILMVSGPTKSGKTVLLRRVIPRDTCFWIPGGEVSSYEDFWLRVCRAVGQPSQTTVGSTDAATEGSTQELDLGARPYGVGVGVKGSLQASRAVGNVESRSYTHEATLEGPRLLREQKRPLVVDDFHYLEADVRHRIVRSLKDPVFEGVPVVFLCVPHRAIDAVRDEPEMTGRVEVLEVPPWRADELESIATLGFGALRLQPAPGVVHRLVREAFESPFLMQDLCSALCLTHDVYAQQHADRELPAPADWDQFFRDKASGFESDAFNRLAQGPPTRGNDRLQRPLRSGGEADLYRATLIALAACNGALEIPYIPMLRDAFREVLVTLPQANEVTNVLKQMKEIARTAARGAEGAPGDGVPVMDFDADLSRVIITDPFFAYFLRWRGAEAARQ